MKIKITLLFLFLSSIIIAQSTVSGIIKNKKTGEPVPFVNLGLVGKGLGTVSDELGKFELLIPSKNIEGKFIISSIGFEKVIFHSIKDFTESIAISNVILMEEDIGLMDEVIVQSNKSRILKKAKRNKYALGFDNGKLGKELGSEQYVSNTSELNFIDVNVIENENDTILFRLNIYELKEGVPALKFNSNNIYVKLVNYHKGRVEIDLSSFNINVKRNYLISLECIEESNKIMFKAEKGNSFFRLVSHDVWRKGVVKLDCEVYYK